MSKWRWLCLNCGFVHISDCPREHVDEVLAAKALCPLCSEPLREPIEQSKTEAAVVDYYTR